MSDHTSAYVNDVDAFTWYVERDRLLPDRVDRYERAFGDMVIWDNRGAMHRAPDRGTAGTHAVIEPRRLAVELNSQESALALAVSEISNLPRAGSLSQHEHRRSRG